MASIVERNGKYAVVYYEGNERHPVWKSGLSYIQVKKLKDRKSAAEKSGEMKRRRRGKKQGLKKSHLKAVMPAQTLQMLPSRNLWKSLLLLMEQNIGGIPITQEIKLK